MKKLPGKCTQKIDFFFKIVYSNMVGGWCRQKTPFGKRSVYMRVWRNWQTRKIQVLVGAIRYRFKSCYPHQTRKKRTQEMSCVRFFFSVRTGGSSAASVCLFYAGMHEGDIPRRAFIRNITLIFRKLQTFYVIVLR